MKQIHKKLLIDESSLIVLIWSVTTGCRVKKEWTTQSIVSKHNSGKKWSLHGITLFKVEYAGTINMVGLVLNTRMSWLRYNQAVCVASSLTNHLTSITSFSDIQMGKIRTTTYEWNKTYFFFIIIREQSINQPTLNLASSWRSMYASNSSCLIKASWSACI